jgi:hypothetical protein
VCSLPTSVSEEPGDTASDDDDDDAEQDGTDDGGSGEGDDDQPADDDPDTDDDAKGFALRVIGEATGLSHTAVAKILARWGFWFGCWESVDSPCGWVYLSVWCSDGPDTRNRRSAMDMDQAVVKAAEIGAEHGLAAASWVTDGNTSVETFRVLRDGIVEGDPEVLDRLPAADLSGEWADGYTSRRLFEDATGLDAHAEATWNVDEYDWMVDGLCAAYEEAFQSVVLGELERVCEYHLGAEVTR